MAEDAVGRRHPAGRLAVAKRSLEVQATERLREEIVAGRITPGSRLTEQGLAAATGLSRATVRAALARLTRDGLVAQIPYTGWAVCELTADHAWELYTLRSSLEGLGARLAAAQADPAALRRVEQAFQELVAACQEGIPSVMADHDFKLHATIIAAAAHGRLAEQYRIVEHQIRMYIISSDALIGDPVELADQHRSLVAAVLGGDAAEAESEAVQHNICEGEKLVNHLRKVAPGKATQP